MLRHVEILGLSLSLCLLACGDDGQVAAADSGPAEEQQDGQDAQADQLQDASASDLILCNGHEALCALAYDEVSYPTTHNANAAQSYGYAINANQISGLSSQLQDGVRCLLMDVTYDDDGETALCHGPCSLASTSHLSGLAEIKDFMDDNPREVVTIIFEDSISEVDLEADFMTSGLIDLVFTMDSQWPTLGEMIDSGRRLVITTESGSAPPAWIHHVWDVAFDTPYTFMSVDDFSCELNRGSRDSDLFLMNHWVNTSINLPSEEDAKQVNLSDVLLARALSCEQEAGQRPNFVAVDFYEHGDLFEVVDTLNGL